MPFDDCEPIWTSRFWPRITFDGQSQSGQKQLNKFETILLRTIFFYFNEISVELYPEKHWKVKILYLNKCNVVRFDF